MMTPGVVSEVICDDPKITEHRIYDIGVHAYRYRWDCGNKAHADMFYINGDDEQGWVENKRAFVKSLFESEGK